MVGQYPTCPGPRYAPGPDDMSVMGLPCHPSYKTYLKLHVISQFKTNTSCDKLIYRVSQKEVPPTDHSKISGWIIVKIFIAQKRIVKK